MAAYEFAGRPIQQIEIDKVLSGLSCGGDRLPRLSFPTNAHAIRCLHLDARRISAIALANNSQCLSTDVQRTLFIRRLVSYTVSRAGTGTQMDDIALEAAARGMAKDPDWSLSCGIAGLIKRTKQRKPKPDLIPPETPELIIAVSNTYRLLELTHPNHLIRESELTGNCVGLTYQPFLALQRGLSQDDPRLLTYWRRINKGISRIFSIRNACGQAVATLEYNNSSQFIQQVSFAESWKREKRSALSFTVQAFRDNALPLTSIHVPRDMRRLDGALARDGRWGKFRELPQDEIIGGYLKVYREAEPAVISKYLRTPGLQIGFAAECNRLMPYLTGTMACDTVNSLTKVWPGDISAIIGCQALFENVEKAEFTKLSRIFRGGLVLTSLIEGDFPVLASASNRLSICAARRWSFPALRDATGLVVPEFLQDRMPLVTLTQGISSQTVIILDPQHRVRSDV